MRNTKLVAGIVAAAMMAVTVVGCGAQTTTQTSENVTPEATEAAGTTEGAGEEVVEASEDVETPELKNYKLLWSDEFNGNTLNDEIWNRELRDPGWTNNELQEYTSSDENIFVRDGKLVLKALKTQTDTGADYYTSGKVNSQNKMDFTYGRVVVGAKVPEGQGLWPAIWMMPQDESRYGQWPKCGEIDIMEVLCNDPTMAYQTIHYGEPHGEQQGTLKLEDGSSFADGFHEYTVEWEPGMFRYYTDGQLTLTVTDWFSAVAGEDDKPFPAPFDQPFFVQMNLAVGGNWPGNPDETTDFDKAEFEIDYVRVYQRESYNTDVKKPKKNFREPLEDGNYIYNGDFSVEEDLEDVNDWNFLLFNDGVGSAHIENNAIVIETENEGTEEYSIQLVQAKMPVLKDHTYKVSFDIKADEDRDAVVCVSAPTAGWIRYLQDTTISVGTDWTTYTFEFTSTEKDDNNGRLEFNMGNHGYTSTIYITNVRFEDITE
ncbi:MAG: family 16 glycosylhydrolase [Lachnospiraceae bacterium]|nr:family 16 glycosylhydrolase [Candidatus Merdinaster equi]